MPSPSAKRTWCATASDVTIVTYGMMVHRAMDAAAALAKEGIECEVIDLRTLSPIDWDTVIESVENTGRLVCVDEANPRCSIASDVSAKVAQEAFKALKGADPDGDRAAHAGAVLAGARGPLHPDAPTPIADAVRKTVADREGRLRWTRTSASSRWSCRNGASR